MKRIIITLSTLTLFSCISNDVIEIDGCQYIETTTYNNGVRSTLIHKGNCNNPIHKIQQTTISEGDKKYEDISHLAFDSILISPIQ